MIEFRLDARSGVPTYLQLVQQVKQALRLGILHPGRPAADGEGGRRRPRDQPQHRAQGLPRARLEGLAEGRRGQGTFVSSRSPPLAPDHATRSADLRAGSARARGAGLDEESIVALFATPCARRIVRVA